MLKIGDYITENVSYRTPTEDDPETYSRLELYKIVEQHKNYDSIVIGKLVAFFSEDNKWEKYSHNNTRQFYKKDDPCETKVLEDILDKLHSGPEVLKNTLKQLMKTEIKLYSNNTLVLESNDPVSFLNSVVDTILNERKLLALNLLYNIFQICLGDGNYNGIEPNKRVECLSTYLQNINSPYKLYINYIKDVDLISTVSTNGQYITLQVPTNNINKYVAVKSTNKGYYHIFHSDGIPIGFSFFINGQPILPANCLVIEGKWGEDDTELDLAYVPTSKFDTIFNCYKYDKLTQVRAPSDSKVIRIKTNDGVEIYKVLDSAVCAFRYTQR